MSDPENSAFLRRTAARLREIAAVAETVISEDLRRMAAELDQRAGDLEQRDKTSH
jgi:class 3 adenylate cyclase